MTFDCYFSREVSSDGSDHATSGRVIIKCITGSPTGITADSRFTTDSYNGNRNIQYRIINGNLEVYLHTINGYTFGLIFFDMLYEVVHKLILLIL